MGALPSVRAIVAVLASCSACTPDLDRSQFACAFGGPCDAGGAAAEKVEVEVLDPCNQQAIEQVDFLRFEPRGTGIDSASHTTVQLAGSTTARLVNLPAPEDLRIVVTGHREDASNHPSAIGVSQTFGLSLREGAQTVRVLLGLVDRFYKTTGLANSVNCSSLNVPRYGATATYIPESGHVLVVGGVSLQGGTIEYPRTIELFDPATGMFEVVGELRSGGARAFHTATLMDDGRVLIAGGEAIGGNKTVSLLSALVIDARDPTRVGVTDIIRMPIARSGHTASLLADGRVVLLGGRILDAAGHSYVTRIDVFDPSLTKFLDPVASEIGGTLDLAVGRFAHSGYGSEDRQARRGRRSSTWPAPSCRSSRRPRRAATSVRSSTGPPSPRTAACS